MFDEAPPSVAVQPRPLLRPSAPSPISSCTRAGTGSPIVSPIAADTSSPTRSSSASGPIGCPAPRRMQVSMSSGSMPVSSSSRTALNRYGNSSRLTTKPGMSGTSTGVFSKSSHSASVRARVSALAPAGKTSSISCILVTGLNTCSPRKRSGRPLASARRCTDSDEVVVARIASAPMIASSSACSRALTSWSSTTASTT